MKADENTIIVTMSAKIDKLEYQIKKLQSEVADNSIYKEAFKKFLNNGMEEKTSDLFWRDLIIAYTSASNSTSARMAVEWTDYIVDQYKSRKK